MTSRAVPGRSAGTRIGVLSSKLLSLLLAALLAVSFVWRGTTSAEAPKLRVGVILPLSGDGASIGRALRNGITLAMEELSPAAKGKITLFFEDDQLSPSRAISAFQKLVAANDIGVVINLSSATANAIAPLAESRGMPFIAVASDPKIVSGRRHVFNLWITPKAEVDATLQEIRRLGYQRIGWVSTIHDGPISVRQAFDEAKPSDLTIAIEEEFAPEQRDFKSFLTRVRGVHDLQAISVVLMPGQVGTFARQARTMGVTAPLIGWEMMGEPSEIALAQGALEGAWLVNSAQPNNDFLERYMRRFPGEGHFTAANGYDAIRLIEGALQQGATTGEGIREFLATLTNFSGALGTYSASGDNRFTLPAGIEEISGGVSRPRR